MRKLTTEQWIEKAKVVHGDKYNYSKVMYVGSKIKVTILCPVHGEFEQIPNSHLQGCGCILCAHSIKTTKEEFIAKSIELHGFKYDYSKMSFVDSITKVKIICPTHGEFEQTPYNHLRSKGCSKCVGNNLMTNNEFITASRITHANKYAYNKVHYVNSLTKVIITCPIHGDFAQRAGHHLEGKGCPNCAVTGFDKTKPAYLYYLKITTENSQILYKIGITNRTVKARFNLIDLNKIEIVKQKLYENGQDALEEETRIKCQFKEFQYKGPDVLESGNTELFTEDILDVYYRY